MDMSELIVAANPNKQKHKKKHKHKGRKGSKMSKTQEALTPVEKPIDVDMDDEETKQKTKELAMQFNKSIRHFIEVFVVGKRSKETKEAATHFLKGLWECANEEYFNAIISAPMESNSAALISYILKQKAKDEKEEQEKKSLANPESGMKMTDVFQFIKKSLKKANHQIFSHQNLELYSSIYPLVGNNRPGALAGGMNASASTNVAGNSQNIFIFEREPCMKCYKGQTEDFNTQNINDIKSDMKSNEQSIVYKLGNPMQIREVIMNVTETKGAKRANELSIYINNSQKAELSAIKRDKSVWTYIMTMKLTDGRGEKKCKFPVPITACNLMFEFHVVTSNRTTTSADSGGNAFGDAYGGGGGYDYDGGFKYNSYLGSRSQPYHTFSVSNREVLNCPRCRTIVEDSHGVCNICKDNAFQCHYCHNINYENLEAFLCNECGRSRYGQFEFSINSKPDFAVEKIKNEKMKEDAEKTLESILEK